MNRKNTQVIISKLTDIEFTWIFQHALHHIHLTPFCITLHCLTIPLSLPYTIPGDNHLPPDCTLRAPQDLYLCRSLVPQIFVASQAYYFGAHHEGVFQDWSPVFKKRKITNPSSLYFIQHDQPPTIFRLCPQLLKFCQSHQFCHNCQPLQAT